jgi:ribosomal-protein-alanine N-acetyltransferase
LSRLRPARAEEAAALADVHASAFDDPWSADEIRRFATAGGAWALVCDDEGAISGFVICRVIAGEAEILTLAVRSDRRRQGVGSALLAQAMGLAAGSANHMFLEVAADNDGAIALYDAAGFSTVGRRSGYYRRRAGGAVDALVMRRPLNS